MMKNIYAPMSGALAQERVLELVANNLANMNTNGYKEDKITFKLLEPEPYKNYPTPLPPANYNVDFEDVMPLRGNEFSYVGVADVERDMSQGPAVETGNETDFMIEGDAFFQVHTKEGMRYTRDGHFVLTPEGALVTAAGNPVMGEKGAIFLKGNSFEVNRLGEIYQNGNLVDRLQLFEFPSQKSLERVGQNLYFFGGAEEEQKLVTTPSVRQGMLEGSNASAIKNLTAMIIAHRSYEAYLKTISQYDRMMEKSANQLGEVRT